MKLVRIGSRWVNPAAVAFISPEGPTGCTFYLIGDRYFSVTGVSAGEAAALLEDA